MIGIIGAMDEEVAILKESMEVQDTMERAGMTFVKGIMSGKEVVVVRSGIGKVNMGICAQILIDCFGVDTLINTGVAGSLDADINIGDIVISTDAVQHDMDVSMLGDPVGQIPRMDTFSFPADEKLVKLAVEVNKEVNPDIQGAMDEEVAILKESMEVQDTMERAGMTFVKGIMSGKEVVVVRSGIGKVNMGICAQILIDCFGVDTLINTGVAGSLDADINIGDIVISTDAVQHDMDVSMLGDPVGQIPRMDTFSFPADEKLVKLAVEVNKEVNPDIQTFTGRVLSGDQFISGKEKKEYLVKTFDGKCAEMEGAAMAQTAYLNKVSYVIIRAISDKADNSATMDYPEFVKMAITHYVGLVKGLVERM